MTSDWQTRATVDALRQRADIVWRIREFFHRHAFAEVQTPTISRDTVIDRYIDPIVIAGRAIACPAAAAERYYLQTSPEFCLKRLLAVGLPAFYQLGPAYRAGERGQFHNPEFTMLEWYRVGDSIETAIEFLQALTNHVLSQSQHKAFGPTSVVTYQQAFIRSVGIDPLDSKPEQLARIAAERHWSLGKSWKDASLDDWLNLLFAEIVQPQLGWVGPEIVTHYPVSQAALAQVSPSDDRTAERFELFVDGVELANGYHELLDADELLTRSQRVLAERRRDGKEDIETENRLLASLRAGMPDSCGCALGVDRLVMVAIGASSIDSVIAFAIERA